MGWDADEGELDLDKKGLNAWPSAAINKIGAENIRTLLLRGNNIRVIPGNELCQLVNLQVLDLGNNKLSAIPGEIGHLLQLEQLYVSGNELLDLPFELGSLPALTMLDALPNPFTELPDSARGSEKSIMEHLRGLAAERGVGPVIMVDRKSPAFGMSQPYVQCSVLRL